MRAGDLRSYCRIYAGAETAGTLGSTATTWSTRARAWARFVPSFLTMRSYGAGEVNAGMREVELRPGSGITERDGLAVEAGPEAGTRWRVLDVDHADTRVTRVRVEPYAGDFA